MPSPLACAVTSVPWLSLRPPLNVFAAVRVSVPAPTLFRLPLPLSTPPNELSALLLPADNAMGLAALSASARANELVRPPSVKAWLATELSKAMPLRLPSMIF